MKPEMADLRPRRPDLRSAEIEKFKARTTAFNEKHQDFI